MNKRYTLILVLISLTSCLFTVMPIWAISESSWTIRTPAPDATRYGAASVDEKIYVIGGYSTQGGYLYSNTTQAYDSESDTWTTLAPMPTARVNFGIAVYQNKIYVIGGENVSYAVRGPDFVDYPVYGVTGVNEVYDPATNTWETKASMPTPRSYLQANVVDGKIYLIGGLTQQKIEYPLTEHSSNLTEVYDPESDTWATSVSIPTPVWGYASAVADDKIFIISGWAGSSIYAWGIDASLSSQVQIFDPQINNWSMGKNMPMPVTLGAAAATPEGIAPKRIYVVGGCPVANTQTQKGINTNQIYDPVADVWSNGAEMPTGRYGLAVAVVADRLYALGGESLSLIAANEQYAPIGYIMPDPTNQIPTPTPSASSAATTSLPTTHQSLPSNLNTPVVNNPNQDGCWIGATVIVAFVLVGITIIIKKKMY